MRYIILSLLMFIMGCMATWSSDLQSRIKEKIASQVPFSSPFNLIFDQPQALSQPVDAVITQTTLTPDHTRFVAHIQTHTPDKTSIVSGRIQTTLSVPVLTRPIPANEEIQEIDINFIDVPTDRLNATIVTQKKDLVGKISGGRVLQPGSPLHHHDVKAPVIIRRSEQIMIHYRSANLELSRRVEAQKDGAKGDIIPCLVSETKKVITARVVGPGEADVL